ncbi:hypothetical protein FRC04_002758 [Tulasnella sp. 424]|nr:hypothetical protein FRC04_002758 [Tulasnella sp. 424]
MEGQTAQQTTPGQAVDDPFAPLSLPPLAQISDFWKRYDRLADIHDKKMTSNLNGNLDVLLIFAALFSAINTTFISITMPDLSPNPSNETNSLLRLLVMRADNNTLTPADLSPPFSPNSSSVVVNCLLYASLSCSLLAAVGAMMSKEWLQSFDRTGQTGPLEEQGRFRQLKFNGVEQWHLEAVIKFLPYLLLLSVILFFAGIGLFLSPINTAVAGIVIAFSGLGVFLSGISIIAGAFSPLCPYQSAASSALLRTARALHSLWGIIKGMPGQVSKCLEITSRKCVHLLRGSGSESDYDSDSGPGSTSTPTFLHRGRDTNYKQGNDQMVTAQAASWLLQTTSNLSDQLSTALFIRTLDEKACFLAFEESGTFQRLLSLACEALDVWYNQPNARNQDVAELFGLALCHLHRQPSEDAAQINYSHEFRVRSGSSFSETFLEVLERTATRFAARGPEAEEYILHISFLSTIVIRGSVIGAYQWAKLSRLILRPSIRNMADVLLGLWAIFARGIGWRSTFRVSYTLDELLEIGEKEETLATALAFAICWSHNNLSLVESNVLSELSAAQVYTACLRKARELPPPSADDRDTAAFGLASLMRDYFDPLTMGSSLGETRSELVELSVEAVLGFCAFLDTNPGPDNTSGHPPSQFLNHRFIDAIADIMLDNPQIPRWGETRTSKPSIIRILLWVWKNTPDTSIDDEEKDNIFVSSCRLFAPLEKQVEFSQRGEFGEYDKPLTSDDLNRIIEFIEDTTKDRKSSALMTRNADVGINRLYVHFDKRADWEYDLFDMREQRPLCSRFTYIEDGLE